MATRTREATLAVKVATTNHLEATAVVDLAVRPKTSIIRAISRASTLATKVDLLRTSGDILRRARANGIMVRIRVRGDTVSGRM